MTCALRFLFVAVLLFAPISAFAFNPPEDVSGTVKLRIEAPSVIESATVPFAATVVIENTGTEPVSGQVRLYGIDEWVAAPAETQAFKAEPGTPLRLEYTVTPSAGAYNARYPLYAKAKLDAPVAGRDSLHAILIAEMRRPDPPRPASALAWKPWTIDGTSAKALLRFPARRAVWQVFGGAVHSTAPGWQGADPVTGTAVDFTTQRAHPDGRDTLMMHPCWRGGAGTVLAEFALQLPAQSCRLTFANAIRETQPGEPASDGVTFRVRVLPFDAPEGAFGEVAFERHTDAKTWLDGEADLSKWAGQAVRLQLESHPGPKNDTTCDESHWGNPMIVPANPLAVATMTASAPTAIGKAVCGGQEYAVAVTPGQRGLLDGEIRMKNGDKQLVYKGLHVRVLGDNLGDAAGPTELLQATAESADGGLRYRHKMRHGEVVYDLVIEWRMAPDNAGAQAQVRLENTPASRPWFDVHIEDVALGATETMPRDVYAGVGNVLRDPQDFSLGYDSHQLATAYVGFDFGNGISLVQSVNVPPTRLEFNHGRKSYTLHAGGEQIMSLIPCANVWDGVGNYAEKIDTRKAAPGVEKLRGKIVLDLWGGRYAETAQALKKTFAEVGGNNCVVVWHNWQRWGYDYRLPDIFPPAPECGTEAEFKELADTCKEAGAIFAPHDNYIDLYPDATGFTYKNVLFWQGGEPVRAWLNEGRGAQAYRWSTDAFWPYMEKNLGLLKNFCAPTGYFVDVWSSIGPYDAWTWDGKYQPATHTRDAWGKAFTTIRDTLDGAPTISEGGHDQLIGSLDGSQCNHLRVDPNPPKGGDSGFVWRIKCADAERVPWFDAAYHDRFSAHGAGYDPRYRAGLDPRLHGIYSDDYICTEVMDGHPPMTSEATGWDVLRKGYLFAGMNGEDARRGRVKRVEFADGDLHRQHVAWTGNGGYDTWVNRGEQDWTISVNGRDIVLPQYGFLSTHGKGVPLAGITRNDGVIVEWSESGGDAYEEYGRYYNARPPMGVAAVMRVQVESLGPDTGRTVSATLRWERTIPATTDWRPFVHFVDESGKIAFQADHAFATPASQWTGPVTTQFAAKIPETAAVGTKYELRVGVWEPGGARGGMAGTTDGERRTRLGTVTVTETGFDWIPIEQKTDPYLTRLNMEGKMVDFGRVKTNGAVLLELGRITPLTHDKPFTLMRKIAPYQDEHPCTLIAEDAEGNQLHMVEFRQKGDWLMLEITPDVHHYVRTEEPEKKEDLADIPAIDPEIRLEEYPVTVDKREVGLFSVCIHERADSDPDKSPYDEVLEIRKGGVDGGKLVYLRPESAASFDEQFMLNLTLNGGPVVAVKNFSGGAHCCTGCVVLELGDPVTIVTRITFADFDEQGYLNIRKRDGDLLVDVPDNTFELWYDCLADSRQFEVTAIVRPNGFSLDTKGLKKHHVDVDDMADSVRVAWEENVAANDTRHPIPPSELFETLRQLCFEGAGDDCEALINAVWPRHYPGKKTYWESFMGRLRGSPFWEDIRKLNEWK